MAERVPRGKERKEARTTISLKPTLLIEFQTPAANNDLSVSAAVRKLMDACSIFPLKLASTWAASTTKRRLSSMGRLFSATSPPWHPYFHTDTQSHYDGIMDSLKNAADHLP